MTGDDREIKTKSSKKSSSELQAKKKNKFFFLLVTVLFLFWNKVELKPSLGKVVIKDAFSSRNNMLFEDRK